MPFFRGKTVFHSEAKKGNKKHPPPKQKNKTNKQKKQTKKNKEGLGPSEVALRATPPDP